MKKLLNLIIVFILVLALFIPANINANSKASKAEIEKQLEELKAQKAKNDAELKSINKETDATLREIKKLDLEAANLDLQVETIELEIQELEENIANTAQAISEKEKSIDENNTLLEQRLRASYKRGEVGYLEIILSAENIIDALTRIDVIQLIVKEDVTLISEIREAKENLEIIKATQEDNKKQLEAKMIELESKKEEVLAKRKEKEVRIAELNNDKKEIEKFNAEISMASDKLDKELQLLLNEEKYVGGELHYPLPLEYTFITSYFGNRIHPIYGYASHHKGTDIRCPTGTEVYAANDGTVIISGWHSQYGYYIVIDHGGKIATLYAHNSKLLVKVGDKVKRGQVISKSGSTGMSTGPHLHFEVRINGVQVDGLDYVMNKKSIQ